MFSGHSLFGRHVAEWQQFVDPIHGMTCNDLGQHVAQIGLRMFILQFFRPSAISRSFCPYRAECRHPLPLASIVRAKRAAYSGRATRNGRARPRRVDAGRREDPAGVEARCGLLRAAKGERGRNDARPHAPVQRAGTIAQRGAVHGVGTYRKSMRRSRDEDRRIRRLWHRL